MSPTGNTVEWVAEHIANGHDQYMDRFRTINRRAPGRFERREWAPMQADSLERLLLYQAMVTDVVADIARSLGEKSNDPALWREIKAAFSTLVRSNPNRELAETFHNSITRKLFETVGVDPEIEFVDLSVHNATSHDATTRLFSRSTSVADVISRILIHFAYSVPYTDLEADTAELGRRVTDRAGSDAVESIEVVDSVFYRGQAAYLIGLIHGVGGLEAPLAISLRNMGDGVVCDAVLLTENEVSILFSFTRSYFHVDTPNPGALVTFLRSLMPRKRVAELYISVGQNKHGKTELYRDLLRHVRSSNEKFEHAPGTKGLVMIVFTMPGYDDVFKIIRDRFPPPKRTTRAAVMRKYRIVFQHDRAGRLMDVQDFQHLKFDIDRFTPELLEELLAESGNSVSIEGDSVVIRHVYVERRITPLDLFITIADPAGRTAAVLDYGQAIKDLASTNIFPGDLLIKNFGVTRHGRVVFYDYDELAPLTEVNFKEIPAPRDDYDALSDQPWYPVSDRDVFPEEHEYFLGMTEELRSRFTQRHGDLFQAESWRAIQSRIRNGELIEVFPYGEEARLSSATGSRGW
ncbi:MAG TPA: bifunctional isocitrate dehydrogenase kinase/phosphatase [Acidimicrobiia bacterium]